MIQVRNVPDELHRALVKRAARRGTTLTDYVQEILEREVARDDRKAVIRRILSREPIDLGDTSAAELIHAGRREAGRD